MAKKNGKRVAPILAYVVGGSFAVVLVVYGTAWFWKCFPSSSVVCVPLSDLGDFYAKNLRGSLFTAFLTLGGFLLSLKTFIVVNMKKEVFDSATYQELWKSRWRLDQKNAGSLYEPLLELSTILHYAILSCLLTSVAQFTVGLIGTFYSAIFCLWAGVLSILLVLACLWHIRRNLKYMFNHLDKSATDKANKNESDDGDSLVREDFQGGVPDQR